MHFVVAAGQLRGLPFVLTDFQLMADAPRIPEHAGTCAQCADVPWIDRNQDQPSVVLARHSAGRERSMAIPLLDIVQRQVGAERQTQGWRGR